VANRLDELPEVYAPDRAAFRDWLSANHDSADGVWLVYFKKHTGRDSVDYDGAVREALCFGWIDGKVQRLDDDRYRQVFMPRRPGSTWSTSNKRRVAELAERGLLAPPGAAVIAAARADKSWNLLDDVEALIVPEDLAEALDASPGARAAYDDFKDSIKKATLWYVKSAKRAETRARRIVQVVEAASEGRAVM
jgi:uncharacterized protein YdeI (YjbR/CyaY-like superfamily)